MHEYHSSDKADALAVSCFAVCHSVGMEHPPQGGLTPLLLGAGKVGMGGKGTTCVWVYALEQTILFLTKSRNNTTIFALTQLLVYLTKHKLTRTNCYLFLCN